MSKHRLLCLLLLLPAACRAAGAPLQAVPLTPSPARGQLVELRVDGLPDYANPFDPAVVRVDGEFLAPSGATLRVPAFHMVPHSPVQPPDKPRVATHMRIVLGAERWRRGTRIEFLVDDLVLVDRETGERAVIDDFERRPRWLAQAAEFAIDLERAHGGTQSLRVGVTVGEPRWPGAMLRLGKQDWSRFDELRLWACPLRGLEQSYPTIEYYVEDGAKFQMPLRCLEGATPGEWRELVWRLPPTRPPLEWRPAGEPQWRLRLRPQEAGSYRYRVAVQDAQGRRESAWRPLRVADAKTDGYLRVSPKGPRYLAFDSGRPFFPIGINLLGRDLASYQHYLPKLAERGGNFVRLWLSPRTLGIETRDSGPRRYAQDRAAQLDALLDLCAAQGIRVMACISDFREVSSFHEASDWANSPYHADLGGPCERPEEFFTEPKSQEQYRAKLRYLVARYGHSPHLLAWEFFNEVNITDGWRKVPEAVRTWHRAMAECLRELDPQRHLITSSFAGLEDDALWEQAGMAIVQRHQYLSGERAFPPMVANAHAVLRRHGKPVLMGEFGRRQNEYAALDGRGVSLHNGLWASVLSGGCGTAMSWWWEWIDEHDLWRRFRPLAAFLDGIAWTAEGFAPSRDATVAAQPDPEHGFGPLAFSPTVGGWQPAPFNAPVETAVDRSGRPDAPDRIARILHGVRHHRSLHNPVTFRVDFPQPTTFAVAVGDVSGYGGASLEIRVDGEVALEREFADPDDEDNTTLTQHAGTHEVAVPAGKHTIVVENKGRDWLVVRRYQFAAASPTPRVTVLSLRGKRTVLVWAWNDSHAWHRAVFGTPLLHLRDVVVALPGLEPGRYRVRPFDPWSGEWGKEGAATVAADGQARLPVGDLERDVAFRLERAR